MKGIYYSRQDSTDYEEWNAPMSGEKIVLNREAFSRYFPDVEIQGEIVWRCENAPERCENCNSCGHLVELTFTGENEEVSQEDGPNFQKPGFTARHTNDGNPLNISDFSWDWSGHGASEWWFDEQAIALATTNNYRSGTGLTADSGRIVAYSRSVRVECFREDCGNGPEGNPGHGTIYAGFVNSNGGYRANWTGFAVSANAIGDDLDEIIKMELGEREAVQPTVCKHNHQIQVGILTSEPQKVSYYLCMSCRQRGVRWEEFTRRNRQDTCPYFRRACKSVVDKSDNLPNWFSWNGDNLLATQKRLTEGDHEAFEVTYVRRKEGFVRRAVLLTNDRTREAWMYRYAGFVPRTLSEFRAKYSEYRQILGYFGTSRDQERSNYDEPESGWLTETAVREAVTNGLSSPLWKSADTKITLIKFGLHHCDLSDLAIQRGAIEGLSIVPLNREGQEVTDQKVKSATPFFTDDEGNVYYLLYVGSKMEIRNCSEVKYLNSYVDGSYHLLRVGQSVRADIPAWEQTGSNGQVLKDLLEVFHCQNPNRLIVTTQSANGANRRKEVGEFVVQSYKDEDYYWFSSVDVTVTCPTTELRDVAAQMFQSRHDIIKGRYGRDTVPVDVQ